MMIKRLLPSRTLSSVNNARSRYNRRGGEREIFLVKCAKLNLSERLGLGTAVPRWPVLALPTQVPHSPEALLGEFDEGARAVGLGDYYASPYPFNSTSPNLNWSGFYNRSKIPYCSSYRFSTYTESIYS